MYLFLTGNVLQTSNFLNVPIKKSHNQHGTQTHTLKKISGALKKSYNLR